jgi:hypothetical protein
MNEAASLRSTRDGPFSWQSKEAVRLIHEQFSESCDLPSANSIYLALCSLASDEQRETFTEKKALIAFRAGVSVRTADSVLARMEAMGLVRVDRQSVNGSKMKAPNTYTLLAIGNGCASIGNDCASMRNGRIQPSISEKVEESEKNLEESGKEEISEANASSSAAGAADAKEPVPYVQVVDAFHRLCPSHPKLRGMTDQRRTAIRSRWQSASKAHQDPMAQLEELFAAAEASDFLAGRKERPAFGFDWLLKPANAQKVLEGNYANDRHKTATPAPAKKRRYIN